MAPMNKGRVQKLAGGKKLRPTQEGSLHQREEKRSIEKEKYEPNFGKKKPGTKLEKKTSLIIGKEKKHRQELIIK